MSSLETLRESLPDSARDLKINLQSVLGAESLTPPQRWGVAIASAFAARDPALRDAIVEAARADGVDEGVIEDAYAAASLMAMNNVFYRTRHALGEAYAKLPARLRMQRIGQPRGSKADFELMALAVSAINGCETCLRAHEKAVSEGGLAPEAIVDAVRIAAVVSGVASALQAA
ncbi:MAG TPA: carboxymuconolactone decarboxylase family protein [Candidatus Binatia bacterium]|nr:carboxymuconolactone decarboxylase family protein [Candidatus Binatia bacterium]